jgi:hypothetical protein
MTDELIVIEAPCRHLLERLRKTGKPCTQDILCPDQDSNQAHPEYKSRVL